MFGFCLVILLTVCAALADDSLTSEIGTTEDRFSIHGVALGSSESEMARHLGEPDSRNQQPSQFGASEIAYHYEGLDIHVTDGVVADIVLTKGPFKLDNGILVSMTRDEVESILNRAIVADNVSLRFGDSDCWVHFLFAEENLIKVRQWCAG